MAVPIVPLEDKVADVVADALTEIPDTKGSKKNDEEEKLDAQAELFVRRVSDSVTKAIAELLNPTKSNDDSDDDNEEIEDGGKKTRRKRKPAAPTPAPKKRSFLTSILG